MILPLTTTLQAGRFIEQFDPAARDKLIVQALSWKQPYGSLMLHGKGETRTWHTYYRGWVLICTSKTPYDIDDAMRISGVRQYTRIGMALMNDDTKRLNGQAIAIGRLINSRPMTWYDDDLCFLPFTEGQKTRYVHEYADVRRIEPFAWHGQLGLRKVERSVVNRIVVL